MPTSTSLPGRRAARPGAAPEAVTAAVMTSPILIAVVVLAPVLLIGSRE